MPRPVYRLASETTSRRLASSRWFLARRAVLGDPLQVDALSSVAARSRSASFSSANRPASIRLASSTSCSALSSGTLPICFR